VEGAVVLGVDGCVYGLGWGCHGDVSRKWEKLY
jgi:hypothetical protein